MPSKQSCRILLSLMVEWYSAFGFFKHMEKTDRKFCHLSKMFFAYTYSDFYILNNFFTIKPNGNIKQRKTF